MKARINDAALALIARFEGCRLEAYRDAVGVWTIGYGHTSMAGPPQVHAGMRITRREAEEILRRDVERFARDVRRVLGSAGDGLTSNQFGALVSFAYNVGIGNLKRSSVLRAVREGRHEDVPRLLLQWTKAGGRRLRGLVRRRQAEGRLWMTPDAHRRPPPVAMVRHKAQEMIEHPDLAATWAAFFVAGSAAAAATWKEVSAWVMSWIW